MQLHIKLNPVTDAALIQALQSIPNGERAQRIRAALTQAFVGGADLAQAVHRLAAAIERQGGPMGTGSGEKRATGPERDSPEYRAKLKQSVLSSFK